MSRAVAKKPAKRVRKLRMLPRVCTITITDVNLKHRQLNITMSFDPEVHADDGMTPAVHAMFSAYNAIVKKSKVLKTTVDGEEVQP